MTDGSITLFQVAAHTEVLAIACSRCDRVGRYRLDTLIARHGLRIPTIAAIDSDRNQPSVPNAASRAFR